MSAEFDCFDSCVRDALKKINELDIDKDIKSMLTSYLKILDLTEFDIYDSWEFSYGEFLLDQAERFVKIENSHKNRVVKNV